MKTLNSILDFGKHKGKTISDIISSDPIYLEWCLAEEIFELDERSMILLGDEIERFCEENPDPFDHFQFDPF